MQISRQPIRISRKVEKARHIFVDWCLVNKTVQPFCLCNGIRYPINSIEEPSVVSRLTGSWYVLKETRLNSIFIVKYIYWAFFWDIVCWGFNETPCTHTSFFPEGHPRRWDVTLIRGFKQTRTAAATSSKSWTLVVHLPDKFYNSLAVPCKTITWNDNVLGILKNVNDHRYFSIFLVWNRNLLLHIACARQTDKHTKHILLILKI